MRKLQIDSTRCIGCGLCAKDCLVGAIELDEHKIPHFTSSGAAQCIGCQHCLMICPKAALSLDGINPDDCVCSGNTPSPEQTLALMRQRRSVRNYKQKNVAPEIMNSLLENLRFVPTGVNLHTLSFGVIDDTERMKTFRAELYEKIIRFYETQPNAHEKVPYLYPVYQLVKAGFDPVFRTAPHAIFVSVKKDAVCKKEDPIIALSYFELLVKSYGLGSCWCDWLYHSIAQIAPDMEAQLGIPDDYELAYAMIFGVPAVEYKRSGNPPAVPVKRV